jgi:hypothetical protein
MIKERRSKSCLLALQYFEIPYFIHLLKVCIILSQIHQRINMPLHEQERGKDDDACL